MRRTSTFADSGSASPSTHGTAPPNSQRQPVSRLSSCASLASPSPLAPPFRDLRLGLEREQVDDLLETEAEVLDALGWDRRRRRGLGDRQRGRTRIVALARGWRRAVARRQRLVAVLAGVGSRLLSVGSARGGCIGVRFA